MPSRPVDEPIKTTALPGPSARPRMFDNAETSDVHERVLRITLLEDGFAADRGNPYRVAVRRDPVNNAVNEIARMRVVERTESQRVHKRDRPSTHREDVAHDPAHAGGCAVHRFDERRVVVRLDLPRNGYARCDLNNARALTRPNQDLRSGGGQVLEVHTARLVGAMLTPH